MKIIRLSKYINKFLFIYFRHFLYMKMVVIHKSLNSRYVCAVDKISELDCLKQNNQTVLNSVC